MGEEEKAEEDDGEVDDDVDGEKVRASGEQPPIRGRSAIEEWIREMKKNREGDASRTILEGDAHETPLAASPHRALNVDGF